jgi:hypothetical protein
MDTAAAATFALLVLSGLCPGRLIVYSHRPAQYNDEAVLDGEEEVEEGT